MFWARQQYIDLMTFKGAPRPMFIEIFGKLIGLDEEWAAQGATDAERDLSAFNFDWVNRVQAGVNCGLMDPFEEKVLEKGDGYVISQDYMGRTVKLCTATATIPLPVSYPVTDYDSWLKIKPKFQFDEKRIDLEAVNAAAKAREHDALVHLDVPGGFDMPRELMGEENLCIAYYDEPELIQDMLDTFADTTLKVLERLEGKLVIDNLFVHEDMAGKSGPLIGPALFDEFVKPYYEKIWSAAKSMGTAIFSQDSDGNMNPLMKNITESGINVFYPMEPGSGMDIVASRKQFGNRLAFKAGIDKYALRGTKEDIRREVEYKVGSLKKELGIAFGLDHRIPNGVPIENYRYYVSLVKEILGIPMTEAGKWTRMGF